MTAGRPGTSQSRKLGIEPGHRVALVQPPSGWALTDPPSVTYVDATADHADVVVAFIRVASKLPSHLPSLAKLVFPDGSLWIAWPRRTAGHSSDITDQVIREQALPLGVVDVKVAAIDDDWSGLKLVWRRENR